MGATIDISKYVYFLPVVILQAHVSNSALYTTCKRNAPLTICANIFGQVLYTFTVTDSIEADRTCTINGLQPRVLKVSSKSGAIVEENSYFDRHSLSGKYPYKCSFIVDANSNLGIIAVIQEMKLRKDEDTRECIDYVQVNVYSKSIRGLSMLCYTKCMFRYFTTHVRLERHLGDPPAPYKHINTQK